MVKNVGLMLKPLGKILGRSGLILKSYSPEILTVGGIAGMIVGTIMACKATLKVDEVLKESEEKKQKIEDVHTGALAVKASYTDDDYHKDLKIIKTQTVWSLIKIYGPSVAVMTLSTASVLVGHGILRSRNLAITAAYNTVSEAFSKYRQNVIEREGLEADRKYFLNEKNEEIIHEETNPETGEKTITKKIVKTGEPSQYARFFDESSDRWSNTPEYNLMILKNEQNYANDMLKMRGHVFLNEVYDRLGIPRSQAGAVVGWVMSKEGNNYIDFGIYDILNRNNRDFVNGKEAAILLDFNVDGVIYDKI